MPDVEKVEFRIGKLNAQKYNELNSHLQLHARRQIQRIIMNATTYNNDKNREPYLFFTYVTELMSLNILHLPMQFSHFCLLLSTTILRSPASENGK